MQAPPVQNREAEWYKTVVLPSNTGAGVYGGITPRPSEPNRRRNVAGTARVVATTDQCWREAQIAFQRREVAVHRYPGKGGRCSVRYRKVGVTEWQRHVQDTTMWCVSPPYHLA